MFGVVENGLFVFAHTDSLFSWSRAVQIRTNLDLVLDWLQGAGLGDIASEFLKKLSVTVNFLCIPKTRLIQVTVLTSLITSPFDCKDILNYESHAYITVVRYTFNFKKFRFVPLVVMVQFTGRTFFAESCPASPSSQSL